MGVASSASGPATCEGLFNACSFRSCSQLPATREFFTIGRKVYESEHKAGETAGCWSQKEHAPCWGKGTRRLHGRLRNQQRLRTQNHGQYGRRGIWGPAQNGRYLVGPIPAK